MAAPRATQFIALRNLARGSHQVRQLHMTGPATYASPALRKERPELNLPRDVASLRAECKRRKIHSAGSKQVLVSRLNADEVTHSGAFSTAAGQSRRPGAERRGAPKAVRYFSTTRTLKAVNDTSTMDFAYLPRVETDSTEAAMIRVPILPDNYSFAHASVAEETVVMKPEISSMSADQVFLPMSELHDGHAMGIDFHAMADRVAANVRRMKLPVEEQTGLMKQIWNDMVDDMTGASKKSFTA